MSNLKTGECELCKETAVLQQKFQPTCGNHAARVAMNLKIAVPVKEIWVCFDTKHCLRRREVYPSDRISEAEQDRIAEKLREAGL